MMWFDALRFAIISTVSGPMTPTSFMREVMRPTRVVCYWFNSVVNPWIMRNVIAVLEVKWCMASIDTHHRRGGAEGGYLDSICASNCGRWILNHLMTFSVDSQRLTTRGHVVFISTIRFRCHVKWVINPVMTVKNVPSRWCPWCVP